MAEGIPPTSQSLDNMQENLKPWVYPVDRQQLLPPWSLCSLPNLAQELKIGHFGLDYVVLGQPMTDFSLDLSLGALTHLLN